MMKTYLLGLAGAALFVVAGCSSSSTGTSGGSFTPCTQASDCPSTEKNCDVLAGQTGKVCQCSTDQLCGAGFVCNNIDKQCQQKCTSDANCQGSASPRKCDTATGQCVGGTGQACDADGGTVCTSGQVCDTTTHSCKTQSSCGTNETQGNCPYGQACFTPASGGSSSQCEQVVQCATAKNTTTVPGQSPVVFDVALASTRQDTTGACGTSTVQKFTGHFYDPANSITTASTDRYNEIYYVTDTQVPGGGSAGNTFQTTAIDPTAGTFSFELCTDLNQRAKGVYIQGLSGSPSNSACLPSF
jgi:hypothetical protein